MDCARCRCGACCEEFAVPMGQIKTDEDAWLAHHGTVRDGWLYFECPCKKLTPEGQCSIYETRPNMCRTYPPGSPECLDVVRRRRTAAEYALIRDDSDPESIH